MDTSAAGRSQGTSPAPLSRSSVSDATVVAPAHAVRQPPRAGRARSENKGDARTRPYANDYDDGTQVPDVEYRHEDPDRDDRPLTYSASGVLSCPDGFGENPAERHDQSPIHESSLADDVLQAVDPETGLVVWEASADQVAAAAHGVPTASRDEHTMTGLLGERAYHTIDDQHDDRPKVIRTA